MNLSDFDFDKGIIPITEFNKGKASQHFLRAQKGDTFCVFKNNLPVAVVLSLEEYKLLRALSKKCDMLVADNDSKSFEEIIALLKQLKNFDENEA